MMATTRLCRTSSSLGVLMLVAGFVLLGVAVLGGGVARRWLPGDARVQRPERAGLAGVPNDVAWIAVGYVLWSGEAVQRPARVRLYGEGSSLLAYLLRFLHQAEAAIAVPAARVKNTTVFALGKVRALDLGSGDGCSASASCAPSRSVTMPASPSTRMV